MKFYTHFSKLGNHILVRGYSNGKRFNDKVEYNPVLYVPANNQQSEYMKYFSLYREIQDF